MNQDKNQQKFTSKVSFLTNYKYTELFDSFVEEKMLDISTYEVSSETVESMPDDVWEVGIFLSDADSFEQIKIALINFAKNNNITLLSEIELEKIEDKDWVAEYQKQLKPIIIGRFFISSSLQQEPCPLDKQAIYIEASRAFGTGGHATTSGCIEAMEKLANNNFKNIFDIGSGSGILSFAAEKIWPKSKIIGCDIESISVEIAKTNQQFNHSSVYFYQNTEEKLLHQVEKIRSLI
jgi:ribosomal protein L11 methyltransferase